MKQKEQAPGTRSEYAGANNGTGKYTQSGNDMQISFGHHQRRVYNFLLQGGCHSVADISAALRLSDSGFAAQRHNNFRRVDKGRARRTIQAVFCAKGGTR